MSWIDRLPALLGLGPPDQKETWTLDGGRASAHNGDNFTTNQISVADFMDRGGALGPAAIGLSATWACVNLLAGNVGSLPIQLLRSVRGGVEEEEWDHPLYRVLAESPNADQTPLEFFEFMAASVELHGNSYCEIERGDGGRVVALLPPLQPEAVRTSRGQTGALEYEWTDAGKRRTSTQNRTLHVRGFGATPLGGMSTLTWGRRAFAAALATEAAATATFRNGVRPSGAFKLDSKVDEALMREAEQRLQEKYAGAMNAGRPLLLNGGISWETISISPEDAQMLQSRAFSIEEICRFFGTPPHLIGHTQGNTTLGSSIEQQTLHFIIFTLRRRLKRFEQAISKQLLTPADRFRGLTVKFNLRGLLRGDSTARAAFYASALQNGWMTINEVRQLEGLPPVPGGDVPRMQMQNVPITDAVAGIMEDSNAA